MYYPLQIPSISDPDFIKNLEYKEDIDPLFKDSIMCIGSMNSYHPLTHTVNNIILPDGCIDMIEEYHSLKADEIKAFFYDVL